MQILEAYIQTYLTYLNVFNLNSTHIKHILFHIMKKN